MKANISNLVLFLLFNVLITSLYANGKNPIKQGEVVFEENKGQVMNQFHEARPDVLFSGVSEGMTFHITDKGISYHLLQVDQWTDNFSLKGGTSHKSKGSTLIPEQIHSYRTDIQWLNVNPDFTVETGPVMQGYSNYYNLPKGEQPVLQVKQYIRVTLKNIWEGVDLVYYSKDGHLESDWIIHNPADYHKIAFEVKGAELHLEQGNQLLMRTPFGDIREGSLKAYQGKQTIPCAWVLEGKQVRLQVAHFNPDQPLIIDPPVRVWGTYWGGSSPDRVTDLVSDAEGNLFFTGFTMSLANIATDGVHQTVFGGGIQDAYVARFNADGERVWTSYYGGEANDGGQGIARDDSGHIYVAGDTRSTSNIATSGTHQSANAGGNDAYLAKFNEVSGILVWATYFGGTAFDNCWDIDTDQAGNIYISGITDSNNGIATVNAHQGTYAGGSGDGFIAKFSSAGQLIWSSYYGGAAYDEAYAVSADAIGNVYLSGFTYSDEQIATPGSHQPDFGGENDAFLIKFNAQGERQWGTYIGGESFDEAFACAIDANNTIYVAGGSASIAGIATSGVHQTVFNDERDAFLVKYDGAGNKLWGTYYGGEGYEDFWAVCISNSGFIYAGGQTNSTQNMASAGAFQESITGSSDDGFLVKFNAQGQRSWGTYMGGVNYDDLYGLSTDNNFHVYVAGGTQSPEGIATEGSFQSEIASSSDGYLVKFFDQDENPTRIENFFSGADWMVYPNPAREWIQVVAPKAGFRLRLLDVAGKELMNAISTERNLIIKTEHLSSGIYLLQIEQDGILSSKKVAVNILQSF